MSPDTSRPSTRKHWLPGVWPGCAAARPRPSPTVTTSPLSWATRLAVLDPGRPRHPRDLGPLDVDRHVHPLEQRRPRPRSATLPSVAADVVGVVVGGEDADAAHLVGGEDVEQLAHRVGGVDDECLAGLPVADQVDEVDHLARRSGRRARSPGRTAAGGSSRRSAIRSNPGAPSARCRPRSPRAPTTAASSRGTSSSTWVRVRRRRRSSSSTIAVARSSRATSWSTSTSPCSKNATISSSSRLGLGVAELGDRRLGAHPRRSLPRHPPIRPPSEPSRRRTG